MKPLLLLLFWVLFLISCSENKPETISTGQKKLQQLSENEQIQVLDTDFSKGQLTNKQTISLWDVQKMHGHLCDGLVVGFLGLKEALYELYPDSLVDRTNTRIVAKSSPCVGDVGLYLSGGRYQFNSFYVDNTIESMYIVQRIDNLKTVAVDLKKGVKPDKIDEWGAKAVKKELNACQLDSLRYLEDQFARKLFSSNAQQLFILTNLSSFQWKPILKSDYLKTDVLNKFGKECTIEKR